MTPLDDELRAAMHARADVLTPAPDPLAGIEARARGLRRRRVTATVAGAALAVAAIAVAVPSLVDRDRADRAPGYATRTAGPDGSLDPASPWPFRGKALTGGTLAHVRDEWQVMHPGSTLTPLFAQVWEPSGQEEAAFVASGPDGSRYGFVSGSESGADFRYDEPLPAGTTELAFALPGDEVGRLLVVTAPGSTVDYAPDGSTYQPLTALADGVATGPREGVPGTDRLRVTAPDGSSHVRPVPAAESVPANVVSWPTRGSDESALLAAAKAAVAPSLQATADTLDLKVLFGGSTDSGVHFVMGQVWRRGDAAAHSFSYAEGGSNGPEPFVGPVTGQDPALLAWLVGSLPGTTTDLLVVVPRIGAGQVSYDSDGAGAFRPVANGRSDLNGIGLVDRSRTATTDRLEVLDGDGNLDQPLYRGPVQPLLCGLKGCG